MKKDDQATRVDDSQYAAPFATAGQNALVPHTPTPWDDASKYPEFASVRIFAGTHYIATVGHSDDPREVSEANAAFIVRACNAHDELLAALKAIVSALQHDAPGTPLNNHKYDALRAQAHAAIAKAEAR